MSKFTYGQSVIVTETYNQFSKDEEYTASVTNRIQGEYSVILTNNGLVAGAIPECYLESK